MLKKGISGTIIDKEAIIVLKKHLIKHVSLITPNIPEAEFLTGIKIKTKEDMILAANKLINFGAKNVLIKGGHLNTKKIEDVFLNKSDIKICTNLRHRTRNKHIGEICL